MLNYEIDPVVLEPYVPAKTELDLYDGKTFVSVVGFRFLNTRLLNVPIPFHQNFEEINLRFYVRYKSETKWRRGVVFIKEIVPRSAIAWVARVFYEEHYISLPTDHQIELDDHGLPSKVSYRWKFAGDWQSLSVVPSGEPHELGVGSEEEFMGPSQHLLI